MKEERKIRNTTVDLLRGIAILMVLLLHTISVSTQAAEGTLLFNIVWTLQMPLFFLISGYVSRFSRKISGGKELAVVTMRKTRVYLYPWLVWTILVRGLLFGEKAFLDLGSLVYRMDVGYWFLFSLWMITLVFGVSQYLSCRVYKGSSEFAHVIYLAIFYVAGMALYAAIALWKGISFLGMKLTLYYMPFFFAGFLWNWVDSWTERFHWKEKAVRSVIFFSGVLWGILLVRFDFYSMADTLVGIVVRALASLFGCVFVSGILSRKRCCEKVENILQKIGKHSLELYLIHHLVLAPIRLPEAPVFMTAAGLGLTAVNYTVTVGVSVVMAKVVNLNSKVKLALFGRN